MLAKENGNSFIRFCHHLAKNKNDALCILLHYILKIVQYEIIDDVEAQELLLRGELYFQSLIEEQEFLQEIEQTESLTEVEHELSVVDKPKEFTKYSFNFKGLSIGEGDSDWVKHKNVPTKILWKTIVFEIILKLRIVC